MYAIRYSMIEANDKIVRRKDDKGELFEAFRIIRRDETLSALELGYQCDCGRADHRGIRGHIIAVMRGSLRNCTLKDALGGIGTKWSAEKFKAFADWQTNSSSFKQWDFGQMQTLFPTKIFAAEGLLEAVGPRNISIREDYIFSVSIREISSSKLEESSVY
jgi:hypothetical protein